MAKNTLNVFQNIKSGDMSGTVTSTVTQIQFMDDIGLQLIWTGTPTGTFAVQFSLNHKQDSQGVVTVPGTWATIPLSTAITASGSADDAFIEITQTASMWIRVVYTATSGSGTLQGFIVGKEV